MKALSVFLRRESIGLSILLFVASSAYGQGSEVMLPEPGDLLRVEVQDGEIHSLRLEIFDRVGASRLYDSGIVDGQMLQVDLFEALGSSLAAPLKYELRAWDAAGELVFSQLSSLSRGSESEIFSINFDLIPAGSRLLSPVISLQGEVDISAGLNVAGAIRTTELRDMGGGAFFGSCGSGSSIRSIDPDGTVSCETDDAGDNLGNHAAQFDLQMSANTILFSNEAGLRSAGGAEVKTGGMGQTFQFFAGGAAADIARFKDVAGALKLSVDPKGGVHFNGGQKVCIVVADGWRDSILVSAGWTKQNCVGYKNAVEPAGFFHLACIFDDGFSLGVSPGTLPTPNCGWLL